MGCIFIGSSTSNYFYVPLRQVLPTSGSQSIYWGPAVYLLVALSLPTGGSQSTYWWLSVYLLVALSLHNSCLHFREHYVNNSFSPSIRLILRLVYIKWPFLLYTQSFIKMLWTFFSTIQCIGDEYPFTVWVSTILRLLFSTIFVKLLFHDSAHFSTNIFAQWSVLKIW